MVIAGEVLPEPELEFGTGGRHIDIRYGLRDFGPFDQHETDAPKQISVGLIGTNETVEAAARWIERCRHGVPAKATTRPHLFPAFPGFEIGSRLPPVEHSERLTRVISRRSIDDLAARKRDEMLIRESVRAFLAEAEHLVEDANPDVLLCLPPANLMAALDPDPLTLPMRRPRRSQPASLEGSEDEVVVAPPDFHDVLKAEGMRLPCPIQMMRPETYDPTKSRTQRRRTERLAPLQDEATRAWNVYTALYYKAGGTPWRLRRSSSDPTVCFVGISFYKSSEGDRLMTSMAQVFNELGDGVVVRGGPARIERVDRQPHLTADDAARLLRQALETYRREHRTLPARLVVHKTSNFNSVEMDGFGSAAAEVTVDWVDLVSLRKSRTRLFRNAPQPPLRGTFVSFDDGAHLLYTRGSVDFFRAYPGMYVPRALEIHTDSVESTPVALATELLALSKMDWNNTQFDRGEPVTTRVARQVGNILRQITPEGAIRSRYSYFM